MLKCLHPERAFASCTPTNVMTTDAIDDIRL